MTGMAIEGDNRRATLVQSAERRAWTSAQKTKEAPPENAAGSQEKPRRAKTPESPGRVKQQGPSGNITKAKRRAAAMGGGDGALRERTGAAPSSRGRRAARGKGGARPAVSTLSIYRKELKDGGRRILITRYYPRGVRKSHFDDWVRALAPSRELLKRFKEGSIAWDAFEGAFLAEIEGSAEAQAALGELRRTAGREGITLLCFEPDGAPCHRHIVRRLIEQPRLARTGPLEPDYADYHKGLPVARLVSH